jgi:tRNA nucleotidyltransferase (CCA-adding enzyme)
LTHDLGKGTTQPAIWPHHYGHEQRSARLVQKWAQRFSLPPEFRRVAMQVARYHTHCHKLDELKAKTILKTLYALDAFARPEDFACFLLACEADARGRLGLEQRAYPQAARFRALYQAAAQVEDIWQDWPSAQRHAALYRAQLRRVDESMMLCARPRQV